MILLILYYFPPSVELLGLRTPIFQTHTPTHQFSNHIDVADSNLILSPHILL